MRRSAKKVFLLCFFAPLVHPTVITVPITNGEADVVNTVPVQPGQLLSNLTGTVQLSLTGPSVSLTGQGITTGEALGFCDDLSAGLGPRCVPGYRLVNGFQDPTLGNILSEDGGLTGVLTANGNVFSYSSQALPFNFPSIVIKLNYALTIPSIGTNPPSSLSLSTAFTSTASFYPTVNALFHGDDPSSPIPTVLMNGQGVVTLDLELVPSTVRFGNGAPTPPVAYLLREEHYAFLSTPEPATYLPVLIVSAAFLTVHWRRSRAGKSHARCSPKPARIWFQHS